MRRLYDEVLRCIGEEDRRDVRRMNALALAYVGDTVYDLFVRTLLACTRALPVHDMHVQASERVNAKAQARAAHALMDAFTGEELAVFRRGRNAKSRTVPKHASVGDYRAATGLEAVLGFLYLTGREERAFDLLSRALGPQTLEISTKEEE